MARLTVCLLFGGSDIALFDSKSQKWSGSWLVLLTETVAISSLPKEIAPFCHFPLELKYLQLYLRFPKASSTSFPIEMSAFMSPFYGHLSLCT